MNRVARWSRKLSESSNDLLVIGIASFLETLIIPIPIELVLVPHMLVNQNRIWRIATATLVGCLIGAVVGYTAGFFLFESLGRWFIQAFEYQQEFESFRENFESHGFAAILAVGITPIPFQVAMITAGLASFPLPLFLVASGLARGIRYYGLALLVMMFGSRALDLWKSHAGLVGFFILFVILAVIVVTRL